MANEKIVNITRKKKKKTNPKTKNHFSPIGLADNNTDYTPN